MRIYACLLGEWIDITETATVADHQNPVAYFTDNLKYASGSRYAKCFEYDYIHIQYHGKDYRINPVFIQIVNE